MERRKVRSSPSVLETTETDDCDRTANSGLFDQALRSQREILVEEEPGASPKDEFWDGEFTARVSLSLYLA